MYTDDNHSNKQLLNRKKLFWASVVICFLTILVYSFLTPILSDDLSYATQVKNASGIKELFVQEYNQYMGWTGRSIAHITLRLFLYTGSKTLFNVVASIFFTLLTLLMYLNIENRKKYDIKIYLFIVLAIWIFGVEFAQTVLWETGACNYLFGATYILGFMTLYKYYLTKDNNSFFRCIGMFALGIVSGWSNENTSGACVLYVMILLGWHIYSNRKGKSIVKRIKPWMIAGLAGNIIGLALLVLAPGNSKRAALRDDTQLSISELSSRFLTITNQQKEYFFWLLCAFIGILFVLKFQKKSFREISKNIWMFFGLYLITAYVIIFAPDPQGRVFFGAGIFLIIAVTQGLSDIEPNETLLYAGRNALVSIMALYMLFSYISNGANLAFIYREEIERYNYLQEQADAGAIDVDVPQLRSQFRTKYSIAYDSDITEDIEFWTNGMVAGYFGLKCVYGMPREEWEGY